MAEKKKGAGGRKPETFEKIFARNVVIAGDELECHLWIGSVDTCGYGTTRKNGKSTSSHRWAYEHANGQIPIGMHVLHKCDVRRCVNPEHLFLGTHADNMQDKTKKGRAARKLTADQVISIRNDVRVNHQIASDYGISETTVGEIKRKETWAHI